MKLIVILLALFIVSLEARLKVSSEWAGGFTADLEIPITKQTTGGWDLELAFKVDVIIDVRNHFASLDYDDLSLKHSLGIPSTIEIASE